MIGRSRIGRRAEPSGAVRDGRSLGPLCRVIREGEVGAAAGFACPA